MPFDMSPHVKNLMETMKCPNVASPEDAEKTMMIFLQEGERFLQRCLADFHKPTLGVMARACSDVLKLMAVMRFDADMRISSGDSRKGMDSVAMSKLVALVATSATAALKDLSFLDRTGIDGACDKCSNKVTCFVHKSRGEDPQKGAGDDGK